MKAQRLDQHHVGELLRNERSSRLRFAKLFGHALERPAHCGFIGFLPYVHDRWQSVEQHAGGAALQRKVPTR